MSSAFQIAAYRYARNTGRRADELTDAELTKIALQIRTPVQRVVDGAKAVKSRVMTSLGRVVPLTVYRERKARCFANKCGFLMRSVEGNIVCGACGCAGEWMNSALQDPNECCRIKNGKKLWGPYVDERNTGL